MILGAFMKNHQIDLPKTSEQVETNIEKMTFLWIELFVDFFHLTLTNEDFSYAYFTILGKHINAHFLENDVDWLYTNEDVRKLKKENPILNHRIVSFFDSINKNELFRFYSQNYSESFLIANYTIVISNLLFRLVPPISISIFSAFGEANASYLKSIIINLSTVPIVFEETFDSEVDFIISDADRILTKKADIYIHPFPLKTELDTIKLMIEKKYYQYGD